MGTKRANEKNIAVIELTPEEVERVERISPETFIQADEFPSGIRLMISENEALSDEASDSMPGSTFETP